ncbi:5-formyltetrahydrofolate cyclo-ligase [Haloarchaeobius sp. DFWS5]|uniref:5-formyltetrahydrofolate cyclo-ligase n=1 Tax=Haloarchaeobius sp. DFWS5 TaxID=3446114 RepID=UPI003EB93015
MDKQARRERVWDDLESSSEARFPYPPHGRIPNFAGASDAADRLTATDEWQAADTVKANPDAPQLPVRRAALRQGKTLYMAVPRLRDEECFLRLDPAEIDDYDEATTVGGSSKIGVPVGPDEMEPIDLVVSGSVAVTETGNRIGKGEGYADLEFALLREFGFVSDETVVATTVHEKQVVDDAVSTGSHDVPLDIVATPDRLFRPPSRPKPTGIDWDLLDDERRAEIPILDRLQ